MNQRDRLQRDVDAGPLVELPGEPVEAVRARRRVASAVGELGQAELRARPQRVGAAGQQRGERERGQAAEERAARELSRRRTGRAVVRSCRDQ